MRAPGTEFLARLLIGLAVLAAALAGARQLLDLGRHARDHALAPIERGPEQEALRAALHERVIAAAEPRLASTLGGERAALLVVADSTPRSGRGSYAAQIALAPVALRVLEVANRREIPNWLRAGVAVILDSLPAATEEAILAALRVEGLEVVVRRVGRRYLVLESAG
ncbi:MAG: hypothetical protein H6807_08360 [Planctomycetes bacterium]|nr:hypothetical protein [Planctomycetota bacterium]